MERRKRSQSLKAIIKKAISGETQITLEALAQKYSEISDRDLSIVVALGYFNVLEFLATECTDLMKIETIRGVTTLYPYPQVLNTDDGRSQCPPIQGPMCELTNLNDFAIENKMMNLMSEMDKLSEEFNKLVACDACDGGIAAALPPNGIEKIVNTVIGNLQTLFGEYGRLASFQISIFYELKFLKPLDVEEMGFPSLLSFFESFPEVFVVHKYEDWFKREVLKWTSYEGNLLRLSLLDNYMSIGQRISPAKPPQIGVETKIYVSEVFNPHNFWYFVQSPEEAKVFESLIADMNKFYKFDEYLYKMTRWQIRPTHYCAVKLDDVYQRAIVISEISPDIIKVRNVDSGAIIEVPVNDVRMLLKRFGELEERALPAKLANVKPMQDTWSTAACNIFSELTKNKLLSARVVSVQHERFASLFLCDANPKVLTNIGGILVERKYARFHISQVNFQ